MSALASGRTSFPAWAAIAGLAAFAVALGASLAVAPLQTALIFVSAAIVIAVAAHPAAGAYVLIVASLLVAGVERGGLGIVPLVRPHEAVLALVAVGLVAHPLACFALGIHSRLALRLGRIDAAMVALAVTGSVLPLGLMVARGREPSGDDVLYGLQLWKLVAVYLVIRIAVLTDRQVRIALWTALGAAAIVGAVAIMQALYLFGVDRLIVEHYAPLYESSDFAASRGTSTVGSSFAVADVMVFSLGITAGLMVAHARHRAILGGLGLLFLAGTVASGQFTAAVALIVGLIAVGIVTRRLGRSALALALAVVLGMVALQPVIDNRLQAFDTPTGVPRSWEGRVDNLQTFFWPELFRDANVLTGVQPSARVPAPDTSAYNDGYVYIESGHTALLWSGGVAFLLAFLVLLVLSVRKVARVARSRNDAVGAAAVASFTALAVVAVLTTIDSHLTLRGAGELNVALLALALVGATHAAPHGRRAAARAPWTRSRAGPR